MRKIPLLPTVFLLGFLGFSDLPAENGLLLDENFESFRLGESVVQAASGWRKMTEEDSVDLLQVVETPGGEEGSHSVAAGGDAGPGSLTVFHGAIANAEVTAAPEFSFKVYRSSAERSHRVAGSELVFEGGRVNVQIAFDRDGSLTVSDSYGVLQPTGFVLEPEKWYHFVATLGPGGNQVSLQVFEGNDGGDPILNRDVPLHFGIPSAEVNEEAGVKRYHDLRLVVSEADEKGGAMEFLFDGFRVGSPRP